jgi:cytosine/adenosine deaminase-related metal-dependent hydrolase
MPPTLFVNAHSHLELSGLCSPLPVTQSQPASMTDWVRELMAFRKSSGYQPVVAIKQTLQHLEQTTNAVGDIYQPTVPLAAYCCSPKIRKRLFFELIAWTPQRVATQINQLEKFTQEIANAASHNLHAGISPHAPHTVCPALLEAGCELADKLNLPVTMHMAESPEEMQWLQDGSGKFAEMMNAADPNYDANKIKIGKRPLDYLRFFKSAGTFQVSIVHGNYLDDTELNFLSENKDRFTLIHCPRSCNHFGFPTFPMKKIIDKQIQLTIGTDSNASSPDSNIANEYNFLKQKNTWLPDDTLTAMLTQNGLKTLGF